MTLTARATKSLRIRDAQGQRSGAVGFTNMVFAHQMSGTETTLDLTSMTVPTGWGANGYTQASLANLVAADMLVYRKNLKLKHSTKGWLTDYDDYVVTSPTLITFQGFVMQAGDVVTGYLDKAPQPGLIAVDNVARPISYTLVAGQTIVPTGWPFEVNKFPTSGVGAVMVFMDGWLQTRGTNYTENTASSGLANTITMVGAPFAEDRQILVVPVMAAAVAANGSVTALIESLAAAMQVVISDLAVVTGNNPSRYSAAPSYVDLASFGLRVTALDTIQLKSANYTAVAGDQILADTSPAYGAWTLTLPTATVGQKVTVVDAKRQFAVNNLTIASALIEGITQSYICDVEGMKVEFTYVDASYGWNVSKLAP